MKLKSIGFFGIAMLALFMGVTEARAYDRADWQAYELPVDGRYYRGDMDSREGGPLARGMSVRGKEMVFLARVMPGKAYTLGLRMPNKGKPKLTVTLYDRWPYEADAKSWRLKTGLALMSNRKYIEYQWHIGTDSASTGNLLFMKVNVERPAKAKRYRYPVYAFIVTPPVEPMRELGRGVTYLRGPSNIVLQERSEQVHVVRAIAAADRWDNFDKEAWSPVNGLIANGNFEDGLNRWHVFPEQHDTTRELGVAVGKYGLRIWGEKESRLAGVEQAFDSSIKLANTSQLKLEFRIVRQTQRDGFETLDDFPLRLDVFCQPGTSSRKSNIYSWAFSVSKVKNRVLRKRVSRVPLGQWFRFERSAPEMFDSECRIKRIRLMGGGIPERDVWVKRIILN